MKKLNSGSTTVNNLGSKKRTNVQWLTELHEADNPDRQRQALSDLSCYIFIVALNTIMKRRNHLPRLAAMHTDSIKELAKDFTQDVMSKLAYDQFKILEQFEGKGTFTSWVAMIANNEIASEFRKVYWQRVKPLTDAHEATLVDSNDHSPELIAVNNCLREALNGAIAGLPPNLRSALVRCVIHGEKAAEVAADHGVTANAIYSLVHRAKQMLQAELVDYQIS